MLRRSHKKSRGGCLECKRRHVKCDEQRPTCHLCAVSDRQCSFTLQTTSRGLTLKDPSLEVSTYPAIPDVYPTPNPNAFSSNEIPRIHPNSPATSNLEDIHDPIQCNGVNLDHIRLVLHISSAKDLFSLGGDRDMHSAYLTFEGALKIAIENPYLIHQLLAFSARHLAVLHPSESESYMHQAITLQTRAVSLFNSSCIPISQSTGIPVLLFATVLGHHVLTDTLCRRDPGGLDIFLEYFIPCLETQRGIFTIYKTASPLLRASELEPILKMSSDLTSRKPRGTRCLRVKELVERSTILSQADKEACKVALDYLQVGFDAVMDKNEHPGNQYQLLFLWCMLVPREYTALLAARNMESVLILGYYAILLTHGRALWQVGDAGEYLMELVRAYVVPRLDWDWEI